MAATSLRTFRLLSLLQTHRYWPGAELAARLEVSVRTLRRDVDRLRELGYPVEAQRGVDGGYQLAPGAALPPLVLDDDEAVALALGLQAAANEGVAGIAEASVSALTKVVQVMPTRLRRRVEALQAMTVAGGFRGRGAGAAVDAGVLTNVAQACRDEVRLRFGYTAADGSASQREVEPARLALLGRRWYLVAYDLGRHDWRSFRMDRVRDATATAVRFRPRELPADDAAAFVHRSIRQMPETREIEVVVRAPGPSAERTVGAWARVEALDADSCRVTMHADQFSWPALGLAQLEAEFTVVRPPEFAAYLAELAVRYRRAASPA